MRNQARKLTPEERREKKKAKLAADMSKEIVTAVFRVDDMSHPKRRFKVRLTHVITNSISTE
jgi:hypothetical protein